jgi:hypothetical protein
MWVVQRQTRIMLVAANEPSICNHMTTLRQDGTACLIVSS